MTAMLPASAKAYETLGRIAGLFLILGCLLALPILLAVLTSPFRLLVRWARDTWLSNRQRHPAPPPTPRATGEPPPPTDAPGPPGRSPTNQRTFLYPPVPQSR